MGLFSTWKDRRIAELEAQLAAALARIAQLEAMLGLNSRNSSKPPSSDPPELKRRPKKPSGRNPGGQPGHQRHGRELVPPEQVDDIVEVRPKHCGRCGRRLGRRDGEPAWVHQVVEVPPIEPVVTEYRGYDTVCEGCQTVTAAPLPDGVPTRGFGPRLTAMVAVLTGKYRLSKRQVSEVLCDLVGVKMSVGSVSNLEQEVSGALAAPVEEAARYVRQQHVANLDETGWFEGRSEGRAARAWLWTAVTPWVTVFRIARSRGAVVAKELLGAAFPGFLGSDRWSAYIFIDAARRQLCWSHLLRDFQGFVDRKGEGGRIGRALLARADRMFEWWHRVRDGPMKRAEFQECMRPVEKKIVALLHEAVKCAEPKTAGMAREILKLQAALFTFVHHRGIEPTNNVAERQIRHGVIWRKVSYGTQSEPGSCYVERILTVVATLKQQNRDVLDFLAAAYSAHLRGDPTPSLLPT